MTADSIFPHLSSLSLVTRASERGAHRALLGLAFLAIFALAACGPAATQQPAAPPTDTALPAAPPTQEELPPTDTQAQPTATEAQPTEALPTFTSAPAMDGAALLEARCTSCHSLDRVKKAAKTAEEWQKTVARMVAKGAMLSDEEIVLLLEYLANTFQP